MKRLFSYYHPKLPVRLAAMFQREKYSPKLFLDEFCKFKDLTLVPAPAKALKNRLFILWGYYVWLIYIILALIIALSNIILGAIVLLLTPFFVAGSLYFLAYVKEILSTPMLPARKNKTKP